jgi:hypothetical protein
MIVNTAAVMSQTSKAAAKAMRPAEPVEKIFSTEKSIAWKTGWVAWLWIAGAMGVTPDPLETEDAEQGQPEQRERHESDQRPKSDRGRVRRQTVFTRRGCELGDQSARL